MKFSEFLKTREEYRNNSKKESEYLLKKNKSTLCKMLAETLKDSSTWNDASRTENSLGLRINIGTSNKIFKFRENITPQSSAKSYYHFPVKVSRCIESEMGLLSIREYDIDCMLEVRYPSFIDPYKFVIFAFLFQENISELDVDNIIDTSVKYLEDKADEILKDIVK